MPQLHEVSVQRLYQAIVDDAKRRKGDESVPEDLVRALCEHGDEAEEYVIQLMGLASNFGSWEEMEKNAVEGIPAGRLGRSEEFGDLVAFIASDRAGFLTGTVIPLDGGMLRSA